MKLHSGHLLWSWIVVISLSAVGSPQSPSEPSTSPADHSLSSGGPSSRSMHAGSRTVLLDGTEIEYFGVFSADTKFHGNSKLARFVGRLKSSAGPPNEADKPATHGAPPWMILTRSHGIEDYDVPRHASATAAAPSWLDGMRNSVVTFVYGRSQILLAPRYVTTDSKGRLVVGDPGARAVHVVDPKGSSFSILGGEGRRLQLPGGVATDAEDNIYIADAARGMVLVYDRYGTFARYVGNFQGENWFQKPTAIAIDQQSRRLYLADSPRNLLLILGLEGNELKRVGKDRHGRGPVTFNYPTDITLSSRGVAVLDDSGSRIQASILTEIS